MKHSTKIFAAITTISIILLLPPIHTKNTEINDYTFIIQDKTVITTIDGQIKTGIAYPTLNKTIIAGYLPRIAVYATCVHELWHLENDLGHKNMPFTVQHGFQYREECLPFLY